ncbi:MAG: nuclear transport factor 2 family protein [Acidimicrobiia bacterium]|nr:nuclear transport factor 2 family protein [Acidimicrobiia bacterium]
MATAVETVDAFIELICARDVESACDHLAPDVVDDIVPMAAVEGRDAARSLLDALIAGADEVEWVVHRQVGDATTVMNERTDRFHVDGRWIEIPVAGIFEVTDGQITLWRDYFDLASFTSQLTQPGDQPS